MIRSIGLSACLLLAAMNAGADEPAPADCIARSSVVMLDVLRIDTCLMMRGDHDVPHVTHIGQTYTNVGRRDIEVLVPDDALFRLRPTIGNESGTISRRYVPPPADSDQRDLIFDARKLASGASLAFEYAIADLVSSPPKPGAGYEVFVSNSVLYRYPGETHAEALQNRRIEAAKRGELTDDSRFVGILLAPPELYP